LFSPQILPPVHIHLQSVKAHLILLTAAFSERMCQVASIRLTDLGLSAWTLSLKVRWSDFQLITRSVSRTQGFRHAVEMLPVLHALLFQLGNQKRAVRLLGVFVSNLRAVCDWQIESIMPLALWDEC
jgi:impB/mucB/samB family C-terminal domain